ncbi:ROK family protein [Arthrobacter sp. zg-Y916]|uniref:ROK family protein n=1 Tax=Arthrobacter sp. zg-Y916 TaxID=2894190 RepID=UPI001E326647|nr:ROK family protein [Arthrobacter sp. zg-Y916]MCC9194544.1 ROK family protein [Arthrobacter sp. zg-Y916]
MHPLVPRDGNGLVLALDVGGTDIKVALQDGSGTLHGLRRLSTPRDAQRPGDVVVEEVARLLADYQEQAGSVPVRSIGLVVPGLVDEVSGVGILSTNLGWRNYPFSRNVEEATGLPVAFGHDVGLAGEAEMRLGAGRGLRDAVVMVIGTGIAGALFCDGRRVHGGGFAGEIGHAPVAGGIPCACGASGCLETVASAGAIARRYTELTGVPVSGAREVLAAAAAGNTDAARIWNEAVEALAAVVASITAVLGSEAVIFGGGLSQAGSALLDPVARLVDSRLSFHRRPRLLSSVLGQDAGLTGAALRARDLLAATA